MKGMIVKTECIFLLMKFTWVGLELGKYEVSGFFSNNLLPRYTGVTSNQYVSFNSGGI